MYHSINIDINITIHRHCELTKINRHLSLSRKRYTILCWKMCAKEAKMNHSFSWSNFVSLLGHCSILYLEFNIFRNTQRNRKYFCCVTELKKCPNWGKLVQCFFFIYFFWKWKFHNKNLPFLVFSGQKIISTLSHYMIQLVSEWICIGLALQLNVNYSIRSK